MPLSLILRVFAFCFFIIGTFWGPWCGNPPGSWYGRFNPVSLGLACWVATTFI